MNRQNGNKPMCMSDYTPEYLDIVTGRFGRNLGMEKGIGDKGFRDAALMYRALKRVNQAVENDAVTTAEFGLVFWKAELGGNGNRLRIINKKRA